MASLPVTAAQFQPNCVEDADRGWPRFDSHAALGNATPWAKYIRSIYGELPNEPAHYPICTFDFWWIDWRKYVDAGITHPKPVQKRLQPWNNDSAFTWIDGELFGRYSSWHCPYYHGHGVYHSRRPYVRSNMWVEVVHRASGGIGMSTEGEGRWANAWFSYARGSGIWLWTGRHGLFDNHVHAAAVICPNVTDPAWTLKGTAGDDGYLAVCARRAGYDTLSFRSSRIRIQGMACRNFRDVKRCGSVATANGTLSTWGLVGLYELMTTHMSGRYACGTKPAIQQSIQHPRLRCGWQASRPCACNNRSLWLNCDGNLPPAP